MAVEFIYPAFEVVRNMDRCITCRACERQCANEVHKLDEDLNVMVSDESKCVNCHRCVSLCPTRALKIVKPTIVFVITQTGRSRTFRTRTARRPPAACCLHPWATRRIFRCTGIRY